MLKWSRRIILFILVNILVVTTISIVLHLLGVRSYLTARGLDYTSLMVFCLIWGFGGAFISLALSRIMAKMMMRIQVIDPENPGGATERWLVDTVHRLARNAGLETMPQVGLYESPDPNAFATGPTRNRALVAVSTGLFEKMGKDEIEGVLGHELTHVMNGDMVTMTLLQGVINAFVMFLARVIAFAVTQRDGERRSYMMEFIVTQVLQIFLSILGSTIVMAFSRWREFRADAGGARLAGRNKMINALRALQRAQETPQVVSEPAAISAFKISSRDGWGRIFASHPPLEVRIERLQSGSLTVTE
jgi:heat shock protein HtpX